MATKVQTIPDESTETLGQVDIGRPKKWNHHRARGPRGEVLDIALCGENRAGYSVSPYPGPVSCPDCLRIKASQ
jgi:hypothetical protein